MYMKGIVLTGVGFVVGLGEAFMKGYWTSPDPVAVVRVAVRNMAALDRSGGALQHRRVVVAHRLVGEAAQAAQAKHRLRDDRAGQELSEQHAGNGERRHDRVARHVPP